MGSNARLADHGDAGTQGYPRMTDARERARLVGVGDEEHAVVGGGDLKRVRLVQQVLGALDRQAPPHLRAGRRAPQPARRVASASPPHR